MSFPLSSDPFLAPVKLLCKLKQTVENRKKVLSRNREVAHTLGRHGVCKGPRKAPRRELKNVQNVSVSLELLAMQVWYRGYARSAEKVAGGGSRGMDRKMCAVRAQSCTKAPAGKDDGYHRRRG
jgi:hypothetical protein